MLSILMKFFGRKVGLVWELGLYTAILASSIAPYYLGW